MCSVNFFLRMLRIDEIREKLSRIPEPVEVTQIRENILNNFNRIEFVEDVHKYYLPNINGEKEELMSVSAFIHQYEPKSDWDAITRKYAEKHGMTYEEVRRMWEENNVISTNNGTSTHLYGENFMHFVMGNDDKICDVIKPQYEKGYLIPYSNKQVAILRFFEDLFKVEEIFPVMPEARIYIGVGDMFQNAVIKYAGTFDMLFAIKRGNEWKLLIYDYKTNKSLYNAYNRKNNVMMLPPFNDLIDEPMSHYAIQQSCYSLGLKQLGYDVIDRKLIWLKDDGTYGKFSLPNLENRIMNILNNG